MSTIGGRLKALRTNARLTQAQLSARSGVPQSAISEVENQKKSREISAENLYRLAQALDVSISVFFDGAAREAASETALFSGLSCAQRRIIRLLMDEFQRMSLTGGALPAAPGECRGSDRYQTFQVRDDSMEPYIPCGFLVLARRDDPPGDGEAAVVRAASFDGEKYAVRLFFRRGDQIELRGVNPAYPPTLHPARDILFARRVVEAFPAPDM